VTTKRGSIVILFSVLLAAECLTPVRAANGANPPGTGTLSGIVIDSSSSAPLVGANVRVLGSDRSTVTDSAGAFVLRDLPEGRCSLRISFVGYQTQSLGGSVGGADTVRDVRARMRVALLSGHDIIVEGNSLPSHPPPAVGTIRLSQEELRHTAGYSEDVMRSITSLPGVGKISDVLNTMVVRGGSPCENGFYIDGIPVPDINHLPVHGSSGGPVSLINTELVQDIRLQLGGFDAAYGGKLSSIMELDFRGGDRARIHGLFDASIAGLGAMVEGPLTRRGSFILAARHGYLDQLLRRIGERLAPHCDDYQGKLVFDVARKHRLSALGIAGVDCFNPSRNEAWEAGMNLFGGWRAIPYTIGGTWSAAWTSRVQSQTSFSQQVTEYNYSARGLWWRDLYENHSRERALSLRHVTRWQINPANELRLGLEAERQINNENYELDGHRNPFNRWVDFLRQRLRIQNTLLGIQAVHSSHITEHVTTTLGCRADYFSLTKHLRLSPRISATLRVDENTSADLAAGVYRQTLPLSILSQNDRHKTLRDPVAYNLILGLRRALAEGADVALAIYSKWYNHLPLDPAEPQFLVLDEVLSPQNLWFQHHATLIDNGIALSRGIELLLRQRLARRLYGLVGGSLSSARYRDGNGVWRDRLLDNRYAAIVEGGWRVTSGWRVSFRWVFSGGLPYTPFDTTLSSGYWTGLFDSTRINALRLPPYHSLNLRIDKHVRLGGTTASAYVVVWNVYNRESNNGYFWHHGANTLAWGTWLGRLVILGLEYRF